ncbi:FtsK/SpoIIIE domain-containing protein [Isoptericola sp. NPDC057653]|uniref:FtsK/SpoIIIE domain-containing protein n=1 Tax=Isoptericola sp. NPDC057653 TaxID=3346195 RepID=UPI003678CA6B
MSTSAVPALVVPAQDDEGGVRVTVRPGEDVLLPAGATLGACRAELAALLRRPELRHAPLAADGVHVGDGDVVGERPLLPGAVLSLHGAAPDRAGPAAAVLDGPWLVVRADGVAAGAPAALSPGLPRFLSADDGDGERHDRGGGSRTGPDARAAPAGVVVRVDPRRPDRVTVRRTPRGRKAGRARTPSLVAAGPGRAAESTGPRPRRVGRAPRRWRPGTRLELPGRAGPASWTLHRSGAVATWLDADGAGADLAGPPPGTPGAGVLAAAALPVAGSLLLAAVLRQPAYALFALLGVGALVPQLVAARRRRRAADRPADTSAVAPRAEDDGGPGTERNTPVGGAPGPLLARLAAAHQASDGAWRAAVERATRRAPGPRPSRPPGPGPGVSGRGGPGPGRSAARAVARRVPDGAVALVGPRRDVLAAARSIVVELAAAGASVDVRGDAGTWSWCRWLPRGGPPVLVVDAPDAEAVLAGTAPRDDVLARGGAVLLCLPDGAPVPAWCRTVWRVRGGRTRRTAPDGSATTGPLVGIEAARAEQAARLVAGLAGLRRSLGDLDPGGGTTGTAGPAGDGDPTDPRLPAAVPLVALLDDPADPGTAWDSPRGWAVPIGRDARGRPVTFDLMADGPHLLVAGTTGSGKSELLQSLVLGLAARRSPRDLALALVDFKGGASFGGCGLLPHVVGQVTDLDPGLAGRALAGLRAELHRRERVLARHGAADLAALPAGLADAPPRLVVVVDEFRALADDLPDFLPGLLRVAAQGRSLGVHLVLATQRPAGAVSADVRANVSARLALRVVDAADSLDVVETPAAARILPHTPGRAVLRCGAAAPVALQCAHASGRPAARAAVRRAPALGAVTGGDLAGPDGTPRAGAVPAGAPRAEPLRTEASRSETSPGKALPDPVSELVEACRAAAAERGLGPGPAPWLPPLPDRVTADDPALLAAERAPAPEDAPGGRPGPVGSAVADDAAPRRRAEQRRTDQSCTDPSRTDPSRTDPPGLPVALGDDPARQRRTLLRWVPAAGHLGVVGPARSGRTTALLALAGTALDRGWQVHALVPSAASPRFAGLERRAGFGTLAGPGSPRRSARLLRLLAAQPPRVPTLVVVDGVEELRATLAGPDPWDPLARALAAPGVAFAVASDGAMLGGLAARVGPRLVLLGREPHADVLLGAPPELAGRGGPSGRAAWVGRDRLLCQVLLPAETALEGPAADPPRSEHPGGPPVVVRELPAVVGERDMAPVGRHRAATRDALRVPIGVGGDAAVPVSLDVTRGALVTGPRGSGRTTVLRLVTRWLAATGRLAGVVARDAALRGDAGTAPAAPPSPGALGPLLDGLGAGVLVVDDLDALAQQHPLEADRLAALLDADDRALVAASTTTGTVLAHRGALAELRARRTAVVLHPGERGADEVLGVALADAVDPGPARPGRGALVQSGQVLAVQVARPGRTPSGERPAGPPAARRSGSAGGRLDHPTRHDGDEDGGGHQQQADPGEHRPGGPGREQADADEALHDLPDHDGGPPAAPPGPQGAAGDHEQPAEAQEEQHEEHAHGYAVGGTAHQLDADHRGSGDEQQHLDPDAGRDHPQPWRARPVGSAVGAGRGGDRSAHDTSEYVRPAVSRQCDQALTLHARETST